MKKLFTLLTLLVALVTSAWAADAISCSAYLSATAGSPTVTDCTFMEIPQVTHLQEQKLLLARWTTTTPK